MFSLGGLLNNNDSHITQKSSDIQWKVRTEQRTEHNSKSNQTVGWQPEGVLGRLPNDASKMAANTN